MKVINVYVLWDVNDGFLPESCQVYLDKESVEIALREHYNDHWISTKQAKIEKIKAVSYIKD